MPVYLLVGVALIAHGIGHVLGLMPIVGWAPAAGWTSESWLLTGPLGASVANLVAAALWLVPLVGFTLVGLGVLGIAVPAAWVRPLAVVAAVVSIVAIALFWQAFPTMTAKVGAIVVDVLVLWAVFATDWAASDAIAG